MGLAALVLTVAAAVAGEATRGFAIVPLAVLGLAAAADALLSLRRGLGLEVDFPDEVFVGEAGELRLALNQQISRLTGALDWPDGASGPRDFSFVTTDTGTVATVPFDATRRGAWTLNKLWLSWPSRFGLFELMARRDLGVAFNIIPNVRPIQSGEIATTVLSTLYGVKENRAIGEGSEFHQLREFEPGMDVNTIDWKRSARRRTLLAKELRAERNHHVILALDNGYLMREEVGGMPKIDHAINAALATAWAAAMGGDLVGYFAYDARPSSFVAPTPGRLAFARMRSWSAGLDYVSRETNHTLALSALQARTPKRSLMIIFTDFVDTTSAELIIETIGLLSKKHLVVFVAIRDPELEAVVNAPPERMDDVAALIAASQLMRERRLVFERLTRLGVTVLDVRPGEVTARLVTTYLDIKSRELI
ncbi:MAG: DUF58 domain-containing protein [Paracoccaceae bacterium]